VSEQLSISNWRGDVILLVSGFGTVLWADGKALCMHDKMQRDRIAQLERRWSDVGVWCERHNVTMDLTEECSTDGVGGSKSLDRTG
jgi:hypothetical protein